jgi:NADH:ubiquinone oxidoreductase subunit 2 (subunit N)
VLWSAPDHTTFVAGLLGTLLVPLLASRGGDGWPPRTLVPPLVALLAALVHGLAPTSAPCAIVALVVIGGAFPLHVWLEALQRRVPTGEFLLLVLAQPGLALAVHVLHPATVTLDLATRQLLAGWFVLTALVQTGLGLVRGDPVRAVLAIGRSQAALLVAGALVSEHGFTAEYLMLAGTDLGLAVLVPALIDLDRRHHDRLGQLLPYQGLADVEPVSARLFLVAGWLFVGLPGGIVFFAEDLLFHALAQQSTWLAAVMILAQVFNAVGFLRVHLGVFAGRLLPGPIGGTAMPRWFAVVLSALILATLGLGLWPQLLLGR